MMDSQKMQQEEIREDGQWWAKKFRSMGSSIESILAALCERRFHCFSLEAGDWCVASLGSTTETVHNER